MEQDDSDKKKDLPGRGWTARYSGQVRYRRFTDLDAGGRPSIFFKFEPAPGQLELPPEVYAVLKEMRYLDRDAEHGFGQRPTALTFNRSKKHGRVWRMPDTPAGRTAADIIDGKLMDVAEKLDQEHARGR